MRISYLWYSALIPAVFIITLALAGCNDTSTTEDSSGCSSDQVDCDEFCCPSGHSCCWGASLCCSSQYPHYCASTGKCYQTMPSCSFEVCGVAVSRDVIQIVKPLLDDSEIPSVDPVNCRTGYIFPAEK